MIILGTNSIKDTGFDVANSCNFEKGSLHKTVSSPSATFTISVWVKLSNQYVATSSIGQRYFWTGGGAGGASGAKWNDGNVGILDFYNEGTGHVNDGTGRNYRDPSAWYHWVWKNVSGTGTLYVNGVQNGSTFSMGSLIGSGGPSVINIGRYGADTVYAPMTMAEFVYLDGTAATPTSFGEYDEDSPTIWKPKDVSGLTFGTNGFHLDFSNASALGTDANGGTTLTTTATLSQLTDTPTNNFCTLNPLNVTENGTEPAYSEGNVQSICPSSGGGFIGSSSIGVSSGKWFFELQRSAGSSGNLYIGIGDEKQTSEIARQSAVAVFFGDAVYYRPDDGNKQIVTDGSSAETSYGATYGTGDIIGIALNMDDNQVTFYKNGASQGAISIPTPDGFYFLNIINGTDSAETFQINFGNPPYANSSSVSDANGYGDFEYAVPSGYYSICTKNLAEYG